MKASPSPLPLRFRQWLSSWKIRKRQPGRKRLSVRQPSFELLEDRLAPSVSGLVFQDFNGNGVFDSTATVVNQGAGTVRLAVDQGLAGITVTGFDSNNVPIGPPVTTAANGAFTLPTPGPGQYRVQFSNIPAGFFDTARGSTGTFSGTTVQFVNDGGTVNLGLVNPTQYTPDNPQLFGVEAIHGDPTGANGALFEVLDFHYASGATHPGSTVGQYSNPTTHAVSVPYSQVGNVAAITYDRANDTLYVAAFTKKFTGYGPGGSGYGAGPNGVQGSNGGIYAINPTTGAVTLLTDFNSAGMFPGATGVNFRTQDGAGNPYNYTTDGLNVGWDAVGKTAFGGLDVSSDGQTLYVMNLGDRELYAVPLTGPVNSSTVQRFSLLPALPADVTGVGSAEGGALGDLRPFAVRVHQEVNGSGVLQDFVYIGAVNSAEFTQNKNDLHAYVFRFDPLTGTFTVNPNTGNRTWFEQVNMTYNRGDADHFRDGGVNRNDANWHPWTTSFVQQSPFGPASLVESQPWLTDLAFDPQGNLTLGIRDRVGDQSTNDSLPGNPYANQDGSGSGTRFEGYPDGEALRAFGNPTTGWVLENNGQGPGGNPQGSGVGNGFGPGGGQYYGQDFYPGGHQHTLGGLLLQLPGYPDIVASGFDPTELGGDFRTGGFRWFDNRDNGTGGGPGTSPISSTPSTRRGRSRRRTASAASPPGSRRPPSRSATESGGTPTATASRRRARRASPASPWTCSARPACSWPRR